MKMANEKLTAKKLLLIVVLTAIALVPAYGLFLVIVFLTHPLIGFYSVILGTLIITVPVLLATAYELKKRRTLMLNRR